jgi:hypothetical protein
MLFDKDKTRLSIISLPFAVLTLALVVATSLTGDQKAANSPVDTPPPVTLPLKEGSIRFAVIGDNGTGQSPEFEVANQMERFRKVVKFDFVTMNGDNIYGGHKARDFQMKFEEPYKALLDANVKFYASLGGQRYYSFKKGDAEFFALDSNYMDPQQLTWIEGKLKNSTAKWKICFFHHPLFTSAKYHGADVDLRKQLMPLFLKYNVNLILSGHEHVYERIKPQSGLYLFVLGNSGELRYHNLRKERDIDDVGFDLDRDFMMMEISGDRLYFETVSRTGTVIDSGVLDRQVLPKP